jgi:hypothetical protein
LTARDPTGGCVVLAGAEIGVTVGGERVAAAVGRGAEAVVVGDETGVCVAAAGAGVTVPEGFFAPHAERMATLVAPAMKRKALRRSNCREDCLAHSAIVAQCTSLLFAATSDATLAHNQNIAAAHKSITDISSNVNAAHSNFECIATFRLL